MPNLGKDTIGGSTFGPVANEKRAYKNTLPAGDWRFTSLAIYDGASASWKTTTLASPVNAAPGGNVLYWVGFIYDGTSAFRLLVYSDVGTSNPGARLVQSDPLTIPTPSLRYDDPGGTNQWIDVGDTYSDGATDPFGTADFIDSAIISVYAVYEAVPSGAAPLPTWPRVRYTG